MKATSNSQFRLNHCQSGSVRADTDEYRDYYSNVLLRGKWLNSACHYGPFKCHLSGWWLKCILYIKKNCFLECNRHYSLVGFQEAWWYVQSGGAFIKNVNDTATWARGGAGDGLLGARWECWRSWTWRFDQCVSPHSRSGDVVPAMLGPHCLIQHIICMQVKVNKTEITHWIGF